MRPCPRPLDPIDAEAVAAGADPVFAADAAPTPGNAPPAGADRGGPEPVRGPGRASGAPGGPRPDLAARVNRLRTFSRQERRTYALWSGPVLLTLGLGAAGFALLALPALTASEQVSAGAAALAPLLGPGPFPGRWAADLARLAPSGLQALSDGLRQESGLGAAALALLVPLGLGLNRVLARAPGRK